MSTKVFSQDITDTNSHFDNVDISDYGEALYQYVNGLDAEVTVTIYGTRQEDTGFNDTVSLGSTTVSAGGVGYDTLSDEWEVTRIEVVASTTPSSGTMEVFLMADRLR